MRGRCGLSIASGLSLLVAGMTTALPSTAAAAQIPFQRMVAPTSAADGIVGGWSALGGGASPGVRALALRGGSLIAGGDFSSTSDTSGGAPVAGTNRIAEWSQGAWRALQSGSSNFEVFSLAMQDDTLIAGGWFTGMSGVAAAGIAAWSGTSWTALASIWTDAPGCGGGFQRIVSLATTDDTVYAGGCFGSIDGVTSRSLIAYADGAWRSVPGLTTASVGGGPTVAALAMQGDRLVVGGDFVVPTQSGASNIGTWRDGTWYDLGYGVNGPVLAIAVDGTDVYAGGSFVQAIQPGSRPTVNRVAKWNGSSWSAMGGGLNGLVRALNVDSQRGLLYAGGDFTSSGAGTVNRVTVWDAGISQWVPLRWGSGQSDVGIAGTVQALAVDDSVLYVGGSFQQAGGVSGTQAIAQWTWQTPEGSDEVTGTPGTTVTVEGEGLVGIVGSGAVRFGSTSATSYTRVDATTIQATVPAGIAPGSYPIYVDAVGGTGQVGTMTVPWQSIRGNLTEINMPRGLTFDDSGNLYVANFNNGSVTVYAPGSAGNVAPLTRLTRPTGVDRPAGVAIGADQSIYVVYNSCQVAKFAPLPSSPATSYSATGVVKAVQQSSYDFTCRDVGVDPVDGNLIVTKGGGSNSVTTVPPTVNGDPANSASWTLATPVRTIIGVVDPWGISFSPGGDIVVGAGPNGDNADPHSVYVLPRTGSGVLNSGVTPLQTLMLLLMSRVHEAASWSWSQWR